MFQIDRLAVYSGDDIKINDNITIMQPTVRQVKEFGEEQFFSTLHLLTATGADLKAQLWNMDIDYTKIKDYDLFIKVIWSMLSSRQLLYRELMSDVDKHEDELRKFSDDELKDMQTNPTELILKDLNLADFIPCENKESKQIILYNPDKDITIDRYVYSNMVYAIRTIYGFKRNNEKPANEHTKMDLIHDAQDELEDAGMKPFNSVLLPLVSSVTIYNHSIGNDEYIWNMPIGKLFENIKRMDSYEQASRLLQGACSGFADLKKVDNKLLDWQRDFNK